jgi:hypothetical protein
MEQFDDIDYWKGIVLFGLNAATYKMALAKTLLEFSSKQQNKIGWAELSETYFNNYIERIGNRNMPQQGNPHRLTVIERICSEYNLGKITKEQAVNKVADKAFVDVIPRFQTIGTNKLIVKQHFYEFDFGKSLSLKDSLLSFEGKQQVELFSEVEARWSLLEGAFSINQSQFELANDVREIYLQEGYDRKPLTSNIPFLSGYQGNTCFYCGEAIFDKVHVDHVLPRQVINHDEIWNLVLSHEECNLLKSDKLVGPHFMDKLIARNENIMGSNHPWKQKISNKLGNTPKKRSSSIQQHYDKVKTVLGSYYWGGVESYNPNTDPFFRRLITALNNKL